ncbi:MAG TPA: hypothetical protein VE645_18920 [Pseudonocardiaceae bacterium]|nr:hypothetical protein [Pseudonocardiaceae bacterium]
MDRPHCRPMHCAAIPFIGQTAVGERWIDTGSEMPGFDNHVYLSATAVRQAWELLGYPSIQEFEAMKTRAEEAEDLALELADELDAAKKELQAIDALESAGYRRRDAKTKPVAA